MRSQTIFPLHPHELLLCSQGLKLMSLTKQVTLLLGPWAHQQALLALAGLHWLS